MDKLLTKDNIIVVVAVVFTLIQLNFFATKLDIANLRTEMLQLNIQNRIEIEKKFDSKLDAINEKLDTILKKGFY